MKTIPIIATDQSGREREIKIFIADVDGKQNPNDPTHHTSDAHGHMRNSRNYDKAKLVGTRYCGFCKQERTFVSAEEQWEYDGSAGIPSQSLPTMVKRCFACGHEPGYVEQR